LSLAVAHVRTLSKEPIRSTKQSTRFSVLCSLSDSSGKFGLGDSDVALEDNHKFDFRMRSQAALEINSERTHGIGEKGDLATVPGKYSVASARKTGVNSGLVQLIAGEENER